MIDDSYNANPASVLAGLELAADVATARGCRLHAVLGEMRELGHVSQQEHRRIAAALPSYGLSSLVAVNGDARWFVTGQVDNSCFVENSSEVLPQLTKHARAGDVVFVKASRGVAAERVIQDLIKTALPQ